MTEENETKPKPKWPFGRHTPVLDIGYGTNNENMTEHDARQLAESAHMENDLTGLDDVAGIVTYAKEGRSFFSNLH